MSRSLQGQCQAVKFLVVSLGCTGLSGALSRVLIWLHEAVRMRELCSRQIVFGPLLTSGLMPTSFLWACRGSLGDFVWALAVEQSSKSYAFGFARMLRLSRPLELCRGGGVIIMVSGSKMNNTDSKEFGKV